MHKPLGRAKVRFVGQGGVEVDSVVMDCEVIEHVNVDVCVIDGLFNGHDKQEISIRVVACKDPAMWNVRGKLSRGSTVSNRANGGEYKLHTVWPEDESQIKTLLDAGFAIQKI